MQKLAAFIAATMVTGLVAVGMLLMGINAFINPTSVSAADSPAGLTQSGVDTLSSSNGAAPSNASAVTDASARAQIAQLQSLIAQYQNREKQYQSREQQYQTQLNQANAQVQQYQQLLVELQRRGIIRVQSDGTIQLRNFQFGGD